MKFLDEYRDPVAAEKLRQAIRAVTTRPWTLMEICGGQTHTIVRYGIDELLPPEITLVHGPGCPVCVTPLEMAPLSTPGQVLLGHGSGGRLTAELLRQTFLPEFRTNGRGRWKTRPPSRWRARSCTRFVSPSPRMRSWCGRFSSQEETSASWP